MDFFGNLSSVPSPVKQLSDPVTGPWVAHPASLWPGLAFDFHWRLIGWPIQDRVPHSRASAVVDDLEWGFSYGFAGVSHPHNWTRQVFS